MSAYVIANVEVLNPQEYQEYTRQVGPIVERYGGRFVVRGGKLEVAEGEQPARRVVILEFPSKV